MFEASSVLPHATKAEDSSMDTEIIDTTRFIALSSMLRKSPYCLRCFFSLACNVIKAVGKRLLLTKPLKSVADTRTKDPAAHVFPIRPAVAPSLLS